MLQKSVGLRDLLLGVTGKITGKLSGKLRAGIPPISGSIQPFCCREMVHLCLELMETLNPNVALILLSYTTIYGVSESHLKCNVQIKRAICWCTLRCALGSVHLDQI